MTSVVKGGALMLALGLAALGCKGAVGGAGPANVSTGGAGATGTSGSGAGVAGGTAGAVGNVTGAAGATTTPPQATCAAGQQGKPAYQMLRRLSESEFNNTLIDAFGADGKSWQNIQFVGDLRQSGSFSTLSSALGVNQAWMAGLIDSTFDRAQSLLAGTPSILVTPCTATLMDATCATAMVKAYGYRLFRRPVTDAEVADYVGLYNQAVGTLKMSPSDALAGTVAALMQSPNALYIRELGTAAAGGTFKLSGYELASILSYGLTGTAPSKALLDSAGTGALDTATGVASAVQAMVASPQGQQHMKDFFLQWLAYDGAPYAAKDPMTYTFGNDVANAMVTETKTLVETAYQKGNSIADLLTSPTQRGLFVLRQLICKDVPAPPANVPVINPPTGNVTTRQRYETQHAVGSCGACHTHMDDIGFGLENFDGIGVYRTKENGMPIDASGYIADLNHLTFTGPEDLAKKLAAAPEVGQCLAAQMTAYVLGVSVNDGLCIAPAASYAQGGTPLAMSDVLTKIVEPTHLQTRVAP